MKVAIVGFGEVGRPYAAAAAAGYDVALIDPVYLVAKTAEMGWNAMTLP